jgi:hypothetical protein
MATEVYLTYNKAIMPIELRTNDTIADAKNKLALSKASLWSRKSIFDN